MPYFNFYASQARKLQDLVPNKEIKYKALDMNYLFITVNGEEKAIDRQMLRKMKNLPVIAKTL